MARQPTAVRAGRGGGGRGGRGGRFPKRNEALAPRKTGEVGACKDLDGNVFTIGSGNKGKEDLGIFCSSSQGEHGTGVWSSQATELG